VRTEPETILPDPENQKCNTEFYYQHTPIHQDGM
jgi:hypothetical protein